MRVLTSEQMREVDRKTIEDGVPSIALMENAAHRVVEEMVREFDPIDRQSIVILCGKGNNGGDGLAIARLLHEYNVGRMRVVLAADPSEFKGDAEANLKRVIERGIHPVFDVPAKLRERREVNVVVDALLGTGLKGPPTGRTAELIASTREFPQARIVAVDLPSGLGGGGDCVRADFTVTFTAPKVEHYLAPGAEEHVGRLVVTQIGSPPWLIPGGLEVSSPDDFRHLFRPRKRESHKGDFGHVLVVGGASGKAGAAAMAGLAALRAGAGLVTVACSDSSRLAPELMSESLDNFSLERMTVLAIGPGLGDYRLLVQKLLKDAEFPTVIDADGLNAIAGTDFQGRGMQTVLTPHPGEMARLLGVERVSEGDRLNVARTFAKERNVCLVLKGYRTLIALPNGNVWINTSGSPAMATGGTGDILTGMIAGLIAQFPDEIDKAVRAAVWLHGRAGQLGAEELTEQCLIATDLLHYLPKAIREIVSETHSEEETIALGRQIARELPKKAVVLLIGNLGAGKTTLAKGILSGLGAAEPEEVTSPTFTLIHEYRGGRAFHVDLYRLDTTLQVSTLGLDEILDREAVVLVEWGERFPDLFPTGRIEIRLNTVTESKRQITINQ